MKDRPFATDPIADILADVPVGGMEDRSLARDYMIELASRVEKVLAIHKRTSTDGKYCGYCGRVYPCPTVRILNGGGE